MNRCTQCHGKFGLVRSTTYRHQFCSLRCKHDYEKQRRQRAGVTQLSRWLNRRRGGQKSSA